MQDPSDFISKAEYRICNETWLVFISQNMYLPNKIATI